MEIQLRQESLRCYLPVFNQTVSAENTAEAVVPDTMPDIASILDSASAVFLREKNMTDGRIELTGEVRSTVIYLGEEDATVRKLELNMPCSFSLEDASIREDDLFTVDLVLLRAEPRMVNPRKIAVTAETAARVTVFREEEIRIPTGVDAEGMETLLENRKVSHISLVSHKSFVVTEEMSLPAAAPAMDSLLCYRVRTEVSEQKPVGGKCILQGELLLEAEYMAEDDAPRLERFSIPFSQIMDAPTEGFSTSLMNLTMEDCYLEPVQGAYGTATLHIEAHLLAQTVYYSERELDILEDAYSVAHPLVIRREEAEMTAGTKPVILRDTLRGSLEVSTPAAEVLFGHAEASLPAAGEGEILLPVRLSVLCRDEQGNLFAVTRTAEGSFSADAENGTGLTAGKPFCGEPYFTLSGGDVEYRVGVEIRGEQTESEKQELICGVELQEEEAAFSPEAPSLTLVRWAGESVWDLAKKYGSTQKIICAVNPEAVSGDLLLIPRAR